MSVEEFLELLKSKDSLSDRLAHIKELEARQALFEPLPQLDPRLREALQRAGITLLYRHQLRAIQEVRRGQSVLVASGVGSGKSLAYLLPVIESALVGETSLLLFPTKALAQDQLRLITGLMPEVVVGTYDGDTPRDERSYLRENAKIILSNPDMLHLGILPGHRRWAKFFSKLRFVVVDEIHIYRGVFGSNVANVLRRLERIASHHRSSPLYICTSGTIANPVQHCELLTGKKVVLVSEDTSPRGKRFVVLWNPPLEPGLPTRRNALWEAKELLLELIRGGIQTIAFTQTRRSAEILCRVVKESLGEDSELVASYRAGYLPEERREIEKALASKKLLAVVSTNALELGIDIGSLDCSVIVGYPGSIASFWQQAGRAGRSPRTSLVVFIASPSGIDQYLVNHPEYLFGRNPERVVINPLNPEILKAHLVCSTHELPMTESELEAFTSGTLESPNKLRKSAGLYFCNGFPAGEVDLRTAGTPFIVRDTSGRSIGTVDQSRAFAELHPEAIYLHLTRPYIIRELDIDARLAIAEPVNVDYYTVAMTENEIHIVEEELRRGWHELSIRFGRVLVRTRYPAFKKIRLSRAETVGYGELDLPEVELATEATWLVPPAWDARKLEALFGFSHLLGQVAPLFLMCDTRDILLSVEMGADEAPSIFFYDCYAGGIGFARSAFERIEEIVRASEEHLHNCYCSEGCPGCVGVEELRKEATAEFLDFVLQRKKPGETEPEHKPARERLNRRLRKFRDRK